MAAESSDEVAQARTRARQRLIGAVVLVALGVIGFPLVFETQPRPIPVDIPIEIPRKDLAPALVMPPAPPSAMASTAAEKAGPLAAPPVVADPVTPAANEIITETRADAGREATPASTLGSARAAPPAATRPESRAESARAATPLEPASETRTALLADSARAQALLEGKETDKARADTSRFIVQVGAYAEAAAARDARQRAEKLGLKTYTQVADTPGGSRIRVRVGPFANRDDADKALAKARAAGLGGVVLIL